MLAGAVEFNETTRSLPLGRVMQVLEDPSGNLTIAEARSAALASRVQTGERAAKNVWGVRASGHCAEMQLFPANAPPHC